MDLEMQVRKRNGSYEEVSFDKILKRIRNMGNQSKISAINYTVLAMKVIDQLYDKIPTSKIDELTAEQCATLSTTHPDYGTLASYIVISNHHKTTPATFYEAMEKLNNYKDVHDVSCPIISQELWKLVCDHRDEVERMIVSSRDYLIDYFGFKTLEKTYLLRTNGVILERPQYMWMRVSLSLHKDDMDKVKTTYDLMSQKYFTHATPTLFNAGTPRQQLSSCFLIAMESDSIEGIFNTLKECANISKYAGGIGMHVHNIRACGSHIRGTNGLSNGLVPMLRVFNNTAKYIDQGGKRNGTIAVYLEPWHADIIKFLEMKMNHGDEDVKGRDLFYGLWVCDLFMHRVKSNEEWSLFCPDQCPGLADVYGDEFNMLYTKYERDNLQRHKMSARDLWFRILDSQMETGTPYLCYKDTVNKKTNQKNIGIIRSSNLCSEIMEYSDGNETAVCNLASIALNQFVTSNQTFDFDKLHEVTQVVTENLNNVIDINYYPTNKTSISNMSHRPIGIGVQGLADTFMLMDFAFTSNEASTLNRRIFETMYHAALTASCKLAEKHGYYKSFVGSPASQGILQYDMWNIEPEPNRYDWNDLKAKIIKHGLRNSLLLAPMPTASTSQILGNTECFEPISSNIYTRRTMAGEFILVNRHLITDLQKIGLWNDKIKNNIILNKGSVQYIDGLSDHLKQKYCTVWEIPMKQVIDMAADRGAFICQSQSMNLWMEDPTYASLTSMHFYAWTKGLKTGMYYLRRKGRHQPQQFTIEPEKLNPVEDALEECEMCSA
ncbi:MAG: ribonucleoside-diphosphate reductase subunit alpha [Bacteroidetes bacterium]|nr:ribonucleoside-diphosphate reductase subunit alpha [Bacteroidota bacterium]